MAELTITITVPNAQVPRMLAAFARRFHNPDLTVPGMLAGLKQSAINQINEVVVTEERAALEEQKLTLVALDLS